MGAAVISGSNSGNKHSNGFAHLNWTSGKIGSSSESLFIILSSKHQDIYD